MDNIFNDEVDKYTRMSELRSEIKSDKQLSFLGGLIVGAIIGAGVMVFLLNFLVVERII